jgi:hypothetical protein
MAKKGDMSEWDEMTEKEKMEFCRWVMSDEWESEIRRQNRFIPWIVGASIGMAVLAIFICECG